MKILIVDDDPTTLVVASRFCAEDGHDVSTASGGVMCLNKARAEHPDLILLDVNMPDISGFEVCRQLKADDSLAEIPVVFLTALDNTSDRVEGLDIGAIDYVVKPFNGLELRARIRVALRTKSLQDQVVDLNRHLHSQVELQTDEIRQLLIQKDAFINQLSHDLKTPLTPLVALLPKVLEKSADQDLKKIVAMLIKNVDFMKELVEKILFLAQLNSTTMERKLENISMKDDIDDVVTRLAHILDEGDITVVNNITSPLMVTGDRALLRTVVQNVLSNAVKYNNRGGIVTIDGTQDEYNVRISIKDTGIGMVPDQVRRVFEEFYKVDKARHDRGAVGLGLAICHRIIDKHGGAIWVESDGEGRGTTASFAIPLRPPS